MDNLEKVVIEGVKEVLTAKHEGNIKIQVLTGNARKLLPESKDVPKKIEISGVSGTVAEYVMKRGQLMKPDNCHIEVTPSDGTVILIETDDLHVEKLRVKSKTEINHLPFNLGQAYNPQELSGIIRRNKNMFINMELYKDLFGKFSSFQAEIKKQINESDDRTGNMQKSITQNVTHNIPSDFSLNVQLIKGIKEKTIIDFEIDIDPSDLSISIFSNDYEDLFLNQMEEVMNDELGFQLGTEEGEILNNFCVTVFK